jgi:hypothetical protein
MVKRTLVVLGILALTLAAATSHGFWTQWPAGGCGPTDCKPLYLPVDCPPVFEGKTIVKTWSFKSVGPCPAPGPACGPAACGKGGFGPGMLCSLATAIATPLDLLFGGCDGVYGCFPDFGGGCGAGGACGPCFGPLTGAVAAIPMALGAPTVMFGSLW